MKRKSIYVVTKEHTFDGERDVHWFDYAEDAIGFIENDWKEYVATERRENATALNENRTYCAGDFATVEWYDGDRTEWYMDHARKG